MIYHVNVPTTVWLKKEILAIFFEIPFGMLVKNRKALEKITQEEELKFRIRILKFLHKERTSH